MASPKPSKVTPIAPAGNPEFAKTTTAELVDELGPLVERMERKELEMLPDQERIKKLEAELKGRAGAKSEAHTLEGGLFRSLMSKRADQTIVNDSAAWRLLSKATIKKAVTFSVTELRKACNAIQAKKILSTAPTGSRTVTTYRKEKAAA